MQQHGLQDIAAFPRVSILTRPGGRVQPRHGRECVPHVCGFNPHPSRRTGATKSIRSFMSGLSFQSSPVPEDGCNTPPAVMIGEA